MDKLPKDDKLMNVEVVLTELGFGKFQVINYVFVCIAVIITSISSCAYVFTARDTSYRCFVPGCDDSYNTEYNQKWLTVAVPHIDGIPEKCMRYDFLNKTIATHLDSNNNTCNLTFDNRTLTKCTHWVYGDGDSIVKAFDIPCEGWKRSLVGTMNGAGQLLSLLFSGIVSDKYGRRNVMIVMTTMSGVLGLIQALAQNYWFFLVFEFLNLTLSAGAFSATYILGLEILSSENRVNGSVVINVVCVIAYLILAFFAWLTPSWRSILIGSYVPSFLMLFAFCMIPESARWLNATGKHKECAEVLTKAARMNGVTLKLEKTTEIDTVELEVMLSKETLNGSIAAKTTQNDASLIDILYAPQLLIRLLISAFCWFANTFVYYGLNLNSVAISGNENDVVLNYTLVASAELPAIFIYMIVLRWIGRKYFLLFTLLLSGVACIVYAFVPSDNGTLGLIVYLFGKLFISISFALVYIYTTELFPTSLRNSTLNFCSCFGRIGGVLAPQIPLLQKIHYSLPMITYGIIPLISAFTILKLPETKDKEMPDTIKEAEHL